MARESWLIFRRSGGVYSKRVGGFFGAGDGAGCAIAPDRHGTGTNALALGEPLGFDFSFGPNSAVTEESLLPDRDGALERIDAEVAGFECSRAMRGTHGNQDRSFAYFQPA